MSAIPRRSEWFAGVAGIALASALLRLSPTIVLPVVAAGTGALAVWIVWQDLKRFTISDAALVAMAGLAFAFRWSVAMHEGEPKAPVLAAMAVDVGLCGGLLFAFREIYYRLRGFDGLGFGDVKLAAAGALLVGAAGFSWALFAASAAGLLFVAARQKLAPGRAPVEKLAFGAVLAPSLWGVWILQQVPAVSSLIGG